MSYTSFHVGMLILLLSGMGFLFYRDRVLHPLSAKLPSWINVLTAGLVTGVVLLLLGILKPDVLTGYIDEIVVLGVLLLALFYWSSQNPNVADILKSWGFVGLITLFLLVSYGSTLLDRIVEIGTGGVKLTALVVEQKVTPQIDKEREFKPEVILSTELLGLGDKSKQDAALFRLEAYTTGADLVLHMDRILPEADQHRLRWAKDVYDKAEKGGATIETVRRLRNYQLWDKVVKYESFSELFERELKPKFMEALAEEKKGNRGRAQRIVRGDVIKMIEEKDEWRSFSGKVYYYSHLLSYIYMFSQDEERAMRQIYDAVVRFPDDINANNLLGAFLWAIRSDALGAARYMERSLAIARNLQEHVQNGYSQTLNRLIEHKAGGNVRSEIVDHEMAALEGHRKAYQQQLMDRYARAQIELKNSIAYFLTVEGLEKEKARQYAREVYEANPKHHYYIDTHAYALARFAEHGEKGKEDIREGLRLFNKAEAIAKQLTDRNRRRNALDIIHLHMNVARDELSRR